MEATAIHQLDMLSRDELRMLIEQAANPCASVFLRIERAEPGRQQNLARLQHLLRQAEAGLLARGLRPPQRTTS